MQPHSADSEALSSHPFCQNFCARQKKAFAAIAIPRSVRRGDIIARQSTPSAGFFLILSGSVNVHRLESDGTEQVIRIFHGGESFAEASLLPGGVYPSSARAETDGRVCLIPRTAFLDLMKQDPEFALCLVSILSQRIHALVAALEGLRGTSVRRRLVQWLLRRKPVEPGVISYTVHIESTKAALASQLGTSPETLSRHLAALQKSKLIKINRRDIEVTRVPELEALLEEH